MKKQYTTFNKAADAALTKLRLEASITIPDPKIFKPIETYISKWIKSLQLGDVEESDTELAILVLESAGIQALQWLLDNHPPFQHEEMVELLCRKQHDYGHNNITNFGIIGVAIRICDKIARIDNLSKRSQPNNESLVDSYIDIVGYTMIAIMLNEDSFKLPLKGDKR
jgi:hypothetical protein